MSEVTWRLLWIACAMAFVTYASYLFFASTLNATADLTEGNIIALDSVTVGAHHIRGMIVIPSECHGVSLDVRKMIPTMYIMEFRTWQEPYRDCPSEPVLHAKQSCHLFLPLKEC